MSIESETRKHVDMALSDLEDAVYGFAKEHMDNQPWSLVCGECGDDLTLTEKRLDAELDLYLTVAPCASCLSKAVSEAKEDGE